MLFTEFKPDMLKFLLENRLHDSKNWYDEHKMLYKELVAAPFYALIEKMLPSMLVIDNGFITQPGKMLSRVRRDTRFARDKTLYRDNVWIVFIRDKNSMSTMPCYYFEINQESWGYGAGYYNTPSDTMQTMREMILKEDKMFLQAFQTVQKQKHFALYGYEYKRPKHPDAKKEYQPWLNKKTIGLSFETRDFTSLFDGTFYDRMLSDFTEIAPFYYFLQAAEERKFRRDCNSL